MKAVCNGHIKRAIEHDRYHGRGYAEEVLRQPTVSIREDGQETYIRSVCPTLRTPLTPNHMSVSTASDTQNLTTAPISNPRRVVMAVSHRDYINTGVAL